MSAALAAIGAALVVFASGHSVLGLAGARRARSPLELHASALLVGLAFAPAAFAAWIALAGPLEPAGARWLCAALAAPGLVLGPRTVLRCRRRVRPLEREPWSALHGAGLALTLAFGAFAVFYAASMPMHVFDPLFHFAYKGKLLVAEGFGTAAWTDLEGAVGRVQTHPSYPPGLPALHALVAGLRGRFDEDATRALMALFALAPCALLFAALAPRGRGPALLGALLWISLPMLYYSRPPYVEPGAPLRTFALSAYGFAFGAASGARHYPPNAERAGEWNMPDGWTLDGAADLPLAALLFAALLAFARLADRSAPRDAADVAGAGVLLAGVLLAKNEGRALALVLALALALTALARGGRTALEPGAGTLAETPRPEPRVRRRFALPGAVLLALALVLPWEHVARAIPTVDEGYGARLADPALALESLDRAGTVARGFLESFGHVLRWDLVWILFFATLGWSLARPRALARNASLAAILVVLGGTAAYFLVLLVTPWDLELLFSTAIPDRLLLHLTPAAILATLSLLWRLPDETP